MRAMHNPWGIAAIVISVVLVLLLVVSAIAALFALALFLVRRSRLSDCCCNREPGRVAPNFHCVPQRNVTRCVSGQRRRTWRSASDFWVITLEARKIS